MVVQAKKKVRGGCSFCKYGGYLVNSSTGGINTGQAHEHMSLDVCIQDKHMSTMFMILQFGACLDAMRLSIRISIYAFM